MCGGHFGGLHQMIQFIYHIAAWFHPTSVFYRNPFFPPSLVIID